MEMISWVVSALYILSLVSSPLIIYALFFSKGPSNLPPGSNGFPIVGESIHFGISGPENFISHRMKKYSTKVFKTSMLGENIAVFCGPLGNKLVFNNEDDVLAAWVPPTIKKIMGLKESFSNPNIKDRFSSQLMFQTFHSMLKNDSIKQLIPIFNEIATEHVKNEWKDQTEVQVLPLAKRFSFAIGCRCLMGISNANEINKLATLLDVTESGFLALPIDFPGTTYHRAIKAGKELMTRISKIVQERRNDLQENNNAEGLDLLTQGLKIAPTDTNEESEFNSELTSLLFGTLLASTSQPTSVITFFFKYLTEMPHIYNQVYQEQIEIAKSKGKEDNITWDELKKMEYTWNVVREALRVMPPNTLGGFREVKSEFKYAGFTIPKGWKILWTAQTSHKDPKYFGNPEEFNPSRFEGSVHEPYSYVPFGGGRGICPGRDFLKFYMLTFIHIIVTKFKLEKLDSNEGIKYHLTPFPENGFPVRLIHR